MNTLMSLFAQIAESPLVERGSALEALHDFGWPGVALLIMACGVLVFAFTRNVRTSLSVTLSGAFLLLASGWLFQHSETTVQVPGGPRERESGVGQPLYASESHSTSGSAIEVELSRANRFEKTSADATLRLPQDWMEWADQPGRNVDGAYVKVASSGRFLTGEQCRASLEASIAHEVRSYVGMLLGTSAEEHFSPSQEWIEENVVRGQPVEEQVSSDAVEEGGKRLHALLVFDPQAKAALQGQVRESRVLDRTAFVAVIAACVVALLGILLAYLKIDTATKGLYTSRLKVGAVAATGLIGWALIVMARHDPFW